MSAELMAQRTGYTEKHIYKIKRFPEFQRQLKDFRHHQTKFLAERSVENQENDPVRKNLEANAENASLVLRDLLTVCKNDKDKETLMERRLKFDVAKDLLDRTGYKAKEVVEHIAPRQYTEEEMLRMSETMKQMENSMERLTNQESQFLLTPGKDFGKSPSTDESSIPTIPHIESESTDG